MSFCCSLALVFLCAQAYAQTPILDLRADDPSHITVNASNQVTSWQNEVGSQVFTPPTLAQAPTLVSNAINGLPVVQFNGVSDVLSSLGFGATAQDLTLFIVAAPLSNAGSYRAFFSAGAGPGTNDYNTGINLDQASSSSTAFNAINLEGAKGGGGGGVVFPVTGSPFGAFDILTVAYGDTTDSVLVNGTTVGSRPGNTNPLSLQDVRIGARYYAGSESGYLNGDIAEVIAYNSLLSDTQIQSVDQSLTQKYFTTAVPETSTLPLLALGLLPAVLLARRRASRRI